VGDSSRAGQAVLARQLRLCGTGGTIDADWIAANDLAVSDQEIAERIRGLVIADALRRNARAGPLLRTHGNSGLDLLADACGRLRHGRLRRGGIICVRALERLYDPGEGTEMGLAERARPARREPFSAPAASSIKPCSRDQIYWRLFR